MKTNGEPLSASALRATHPRLRVDRLRRMLRQGGVDPLRVERELAEWLTLFHENRDGALRVLLLELLRDIRSADVDELLREARADRSDGVRLEALRQLCHRFPEEIPRLAELHRDDENLEAQVLVSIHWHAQEPARAEERLLEILLAEARGPRERQALERVVGFLVEDVEAKHLLPRLEALRDHFDDPEDFFGWASGKLSG